MAEAEITVESHEAEEHAGGHTAGAHHGPPTGFIRKYIFSIDHKVIGIQYLLLALFSVVLGMLMSILMRMNMTWPSAFQIPGDLDSRVTRKQGIDTLLKLPNGGVITLDAAQNTHSSILGEDFDFHGRWDIALGV